MAKQQDQHKEQPHELVNWIGSGGSSFGSGHAVRAMKCALVSPVVAHVQCAAAAAIRNRSVVFSSNNRSPVIRSVSVWNEEEAVAAAVWIVVLVAAAVLSALARLRLPQAWPQP